MFCHLACNCALDIPSTFADAGVCCVGCTKARDQKRLAKDAFALIGGTQREQTLANPVAELAKQTNN